MKQDLNKLSPTQYKHYMSNFGNYCELCKRVGQKVSESLEGHGYFYCDESEDCKKVSKELKTKLVG